MSDLNELFSGDLAKYSEAAAKYVNEANEEQIMLATAASAMWLRANHLLESLGNADEPDDEWLRDSVRVHYCLAALSMMLADMNESARFGDEYLDGYFNVNEVETIGDSDGHP